MASPGSPRKHSDGNRRSSGRGKRPLPLRTQSEANGDELDALPERPVTRIRHKSTATPAKLARLSESPSQSSPLSALSPTSPDGVLTPHGSPQQTRKFSLSRDSVELTVETPPPNGYVQDLVHFDFTKIDYELERARKLGSGLWSNVYLSEPTLLRSPPVQTPSHSPRAASSISSAVLAIKTPARRDSAVVLRHEARILSHLQGYAGVTQYVVPFFGLDSRNEALVLEAVVGGSLEDLVSRLKHMTDFARHQELVTLFSSLALDLISGLEFMHAAGVVHADIKPQNILLDVSDHYSLPAPVIRARYIDFSAAFIPSVEDSMPAGGGTWDFMAPEQMRIQKELSKPTFASDIWSLGITLLYIIVLGSPYSAACNGNMFMLREAIKSGDPLGFAKMDTKVKERMDAGQRYIDSCRLALQKDRDRRVSASAWKAWLEDQDM